MKKITAILILAIAMSGYAGAQGTVNGKFFGEIYIVAPQSLSELNTTSGTPKKEMPFCEGLKFILSKLEDGDTTGLVGEKAVSDTFRSVKFHRSKISLEEWGEEHWTDKTKKKEFEFNAYIFSKDQYASEAKFLHYYSAISNCTGEKPDYSGGENPRYTYYISLNEQIRLTILESVVELSIYVSDIDEAKVSASLKRLHKQYGDSVRWYSPDLYSIQKNGKYGFVRADGRPITQLKYTDVGDYGEGAIPVFTDKFEGYIDTSGRTIIPPGDLIYGFEFSEGYAAVVQKDTSFVFIDKKGRKTGKTFKRYQMKLTNGIALVQDNDNQILLVDKDVNTVSDMNKLIGLLNALAEEHSIKNVNISEWDNSKGGVVSFRADQFYYTTKDDRSIAVRWEDITGLSTERKKGGDRMLDLEMSVKLKNGETLLLGPTKVYFGSLHDNYLINFYLVFRYVLERKGIVIDDQIKK